VELLELAVTVELVDNPEAEVFLVPLKLVKEATVESAEMVATLVTEVPAWMALLQRYTLLQVTQC
jgi:hypothetical protein